MKRRQRPSFAAALLAVARMLLLSGYAVAIHQPAPPLAGENAEALILSSLCLLQQIDVIAAVAVAPWYRKFV
jgi:hypothetical protein